MVWQSKTLGEVMPKSLAAAQRVQTEAQEALDKLNEALNTVQTTLNEARTALNLTESDIEKLEASGFAVICLSPRQGSWLSRLLNAENAPSTSAGYSCGYFNIATAPSEAHALQAFNAMKAALTEKMQIKGLDKATLPEPVFEKEDTESDFDLDKWIGKTLGEMAPGIFNSLKALWHQQKQLVSKLQNIEGQISAKVALTETALAEANAMIAGLSTSGIYQYAMPAASGSWASRAAGEAGAPPATGDQYSFGFAAVAVAADMAGAQALYQKLQAVM